MISSTTAYNINLKKKEFIKQFDFQYTDSEDEKLVLLIDKIIEYRDVFSQHKFDIGQTKQKIHVTLKSNSEIANNTSW